MTPVVCLLSVVGGYACRDHRRMSAVTDPVVVRSSGPETVDHATVVTGVSVGRATLSRLYGLRAEIRLELDPGDHHLGALDARPAGRPGRRATQSLPFGGRLECAACPPSVAWWAPGSAM
jgi:hypothetical protein